MEQESAQRAKCVILLQNVAVDVTVEMEPGIQQHTEPLESILRSAAVKSRL